METLNLPDHPGPNRDPEEPMFDPEHIQGLIPAQQQDTMDIRKVIVIASESPKGMAVL